MARPKLLIWIFAGFCAAFLLAACVLGVAGTNERGIKAALAATGRLSFLLFWPAYTGSALVTLFGPRFQPIRHNGREFGLAFASAHLVQLGPTSPPLRIRHPECPRKLRGSEANVDLWC